MGWEGGIGVGRGEKSHTGWDGKVGTVKIAEIEKMVGGSVWEGKKFVE